MLCRSCDWSPLTVCIHCLQSAASADAPSYSAHRRTPTSLSTPRRTEGRDHVPSPTVHADEVVAVAAPLPPPSRARCVVCCCVSVCSCVRLCRLQPLTAAVWFLWCPSAVATVAVAWLRRRQRQHGACTPAVLHGLPGALYQTATAVTTLPLQPLTTTTTTTTMTMTPPPPPLLLVTVCGRLPATYLRLSILNLVLVSCVLQVVQPPHGAVEVQATSPQCPSTSRCCALVLLCSPFCFVLTPPCCAQRRQPTGWVWVWVWGCSRRRRRVEVFPAPTRQTQARCAVWKRAHCGV